MGKKQFRGPKPRQPEKQQPAAPRLDYYNSSVVTPREFKTVQIVLAGVGGTGTWTAEHIAPLVYALYDSTKGANFTIADPDVVQEKNIGRQRFVRAEIGMPKAVAVARRLGLAYGLQTMAFQEEYGEHMLLAADLTVLVGCVDGAAGRRAMNDTLRHNPEETSRGALPSIWHLDCGNGRDAGRVLLGTAYVKGQLRGSFDAGRRECYALPGPVMQFPSLLVPQREEEPDADMSCAEMVAANYQSRNINAAVAVQAGDVLTRLLLTNDLRRYACVVNLASGSTKSYYATPEQVAEDIGTPESFVSAQPPALTATAA